MAAPAGYAGQIGWKSETTWGTAVTVDTFVPFRSESIKNDGGERLVSQGIMAGRSVAFAHKRGAPTIAGNVVVEIPDDDIAAVLAHIFGTVATTGAGPYTHTYTPEVNNGSLTMQVGVPDTGGTVRTKTYAGVKIPQATFRCAAGELATMDLSLSAKSEAPDTALASASYATFAPFSYVQGSVTIGGSGIDVDSFEISVGNNLRTDRKAVGQANITEQLNNGMRELGIGLEMDFEDRDQYDAFLDDDNVTLVLALSNGTNSLTFTAKGYLVGESPAVGGVEIVKQPLQFVAESATSDADAFTAVLINGESSAA